CLCLSGDTNQPQECVCVWVCVCVCVSECGCECVWVCLQPPHVVVSTQALRADTALSLAQAQHARAVQDMREQAGVGSREQLAPLHAQLAEQQRRGQHLEELLRSQAQKRSTQLAL